MVVCYNCKTGFMEKVFIISDGYDQIKLYPNCEFSVYQDDIEFEINSSKFLDKLDKVV